MPSPLQTTATPGGATKRNWWTGFWQILTRFESGKVESWLAARNALGVALPLIAGAATGAVPSGLAASAGALNVSFSDGHDPYPHRARRMLVTSVLVGIAVLVGALCGGSKAVAISIAAVWAFAAGMSLAVSLAAADIGLISLVTLVVLSAEPMSLERALFSGLLAFCGGLLQTALSLALWPLRRYDPERRALGDLYIELARVAASPIEAAQPPPATAQTTHAHESLAALGRDHSIEGERYRSLLNQAERIRLSLIALTRLRVRVARESSRKIESGILDRCLEIAAALLQRIGSCLTADAPVNAGPEYLEELRALGERLREPHSESSPLFSAHIKDARVQMDALAGQLRSAIDLAAYSTPSGQAAFERKEARQPWNLRLRGTVATLRANLSLQSAVFRHAIRLAACVAAGDAAARGLGLARSYWVPMTVAIVLKPDFTATFSRGILRLAGTFVGLALSTALFHAFPPPLAVQILLIAVLMLTLRSFGPANYGIFVTAVTSLVVLMFAVTGVAPREVVAERALNTVLGGVIALLAYWLWPTWERAQVSEAMAKMLDGYREYFREIGKTYLRPDAAAARELDRSRVAARLARSNLEASIDRLGAEPATPARSLDSFTAMLASSHRLAHAMMALEAGLVRSRPVPARQEFQKFSNDVELTLYYLAAGLRGSPLTRGGLPDLREDHHALTESGDPNTERYALVNVETDRITNSLNTFSGQLLEWMAARSGRVI